MSNPVLYIITVLIWGSTWFAIEFQLGTVEPEVSIVYRYALAAVLLFLWARFKGLNLSFPIRSHAWFVVLGLFLFCINYILAYRAQIYITSALTAIAFSAIVWMNIVNARLFFGVRSDRRLLFGAFLGIVGILVLFLPRVGSVSLSDSVFYGSVLALLGATAASFGNIASQAAQKGGLPIIQSNAWGMFYGAVATAIYVLFAGYEFNFEWTPEYVISLLYLSIAGSIIAFGAYLTLIGRIGVQRAGYATVLFPVVALLLSTLFEGLRIDATLVIGTLLVIAGNVFVLNIRKAPKPDDAELAPARDN